MDNYFQTTFNLGGPVKGPVEGPVGVQSNFKNIG